MFRRIQAVLGLSVMVFTSQPAVASLAIDQQSAVIFSYLRVGDDARPDLSVTVEQFTEHLAELRDPRYHVIALPSIVESLRKGETLPDHTVGLSLDGTHRSVLTRAVPPLLDAGLPFTLFVSPSEIDTGLESTMTWDELRALRGRGVTLGLQTVYRSDFGQTPLATLEGDLNFAVERFRAEMGDTPSLFAYPHGAYSLAMKELVRSRGFVGAFGRHSSVAHPDIDALELPRFPLNGAFASLERFRLAAEALPLPVSEETPRDALLVGPNPPAIGFTLPNGLGQLDWLSCFVADQGRAQLEFPSPNRVEVRLSAPLPSGVARINCTLPTGDGRYRWLGRLFVVP
jgi:peptidoglycan/xylan/chitin deacetylase (PgdA/CDA1 family)